MAFSSFLSIFLVLGTVSCFNETAFLEKHSKPPTVQLKNEYTLVDITAWDGITLEALYFNPAPVQESGNPVIIFISSWGMNRYEYIVPADEYASKGYTVISYTARGFWGSGGVIDMAGANDMKDVSTVIDWALANTNADAKRIGLSGISYGGGISILGSARDTRVKCVAAMSCWVDMAESFLGNGETIRKEAVRFLQVLAELTGKPSPELEEVFTDYFSNSNLDFLYTYTYNSSAVNFIPDINNNKPAVFIANALEDSLFTPNQFVDFFDQLTVPKHLEFAPGDHAGPELPGLLGIPDQVWTRAGEWNDYYLLNDQSGTDADMSEVIFNTMNGDEVDQYSSWSEVSYTSMDYSLGSRERLVDAKAVQLSSSNDRLASITTGKGVTVDGGIAYITETIDAYIDVQRPFEMALIDRVRAAVWESDRMGEEEHYRGVPELDLKFTPSAANGTLVVYLLSLDNLNFGHLFTFSPWTFKDAVVGEVNSLSIHLTMTAYDMPREHRLAVVIASHDTLYLDQNPNDSKITFEEGSVLRMPISSE
jgi:predicted acyl esterase